MSKLSQTPQLNILAVIHRFYFLLVKCLVLKPLVKISYIINGKIMGDVKWYQRHFTTPVRWKWLNRVSYKLTKYVMFS
jgi:hypothetical protein